MTAGRFESPEQFRAVMDQAFTMMGDDDRVGPRLRRAGVPQRVAFDDLGLVVNLRGTHPGEDGNLLWEWTDDVPWVARGHLTMSSATANRLLQGKEGIALAVARGTVKVDGDVEATLELVPITRLIFARYRDLVAREYPHLEV